MNSPKQYTKTLITVYNSWIAFSINQQLRPSTLALRSFELRTSNKVVVHVIVIVQQTGKTHYKNILMETSN